MTDMPAVVYGIGKDLTLNLKYCTLKSTLEAYIQGTVGRFFQSVTLIILKVYNLAQNPWLKEAKPTPSVLLRTKPKCICSSSERKSIEIRDITPVLAILHDLKQHWFRVKINGTISNKM